MVPLGDARMLRREDVTNSPLTKNTEQNSTEPAVKTGTTGKAVKTTATKKTVPLQGKIRPKTEQETVVVNENN